MRLIPDTSRRRLAPVSLSVLNEQPMTNVEVRAAHRIGAALLKQSKEKMRDQKQHLGEVQG